jgi:uncharacterized protein CbrC (UPF0167 family)
MSSDQPFFRFHPGAYALERKTFEPSNEPCGVCGKPSVWLYAGNIYAIGSPSVCARCIASGALRDHFAGAGFGFHDTDLTGADPALADEVMEATPGFATFNPFSWPVLEGKPLAFLGYGDEPGMWSNLDARAAMVRAFREVLNDDLKGPTSYALVFREIDGPRYVVEIDLD